MHIYYFYIIFARLTLALSLVTSAMYISVVMLSQFTVQRVLQVLCIAGLISLSVTLIGSLIESS